MTDVAVTILLCAVIVVVLAAGAVATLVMVRAVWRRAKDIERLLAEQDERMRKTRERIERGARMTEHRFKFGVRDDECA